jgi:glycosyltransferase involved in cell wall biosynthesis
MEKFKNALDFNSFVKKFEKKPVNLFQVTKPFEPLNEIVVSVMIRTYNHVDFIKQAIESVLNQKTGFNFEIIIGDDQSNDGTREICMAYAEKYPEKIRLFLHHRENNIQVYGSNTPTFMFGYNIYQTKGQYVAFLCGDDYWTDTEKLEKQYRFLEQNPEYAYAIHPFITLHENLEGGPKLDETMGKHFYSNCAMVKNDFQLLPYTLFQVLNEDIYMQFMTETMGEGILLEDIKPTVRRIQNKGIWFSKKDELFKVKCRILTANKMYEAYANTSFKPVLKSKILYQCIQGWNSLKYCGSDNLEASNKLKFYYFLWRNGVLLEFLFKKNS